MNPEVKELIDAAREYLQLRPAFRIKPIGDTYSPARMEQEMQIAAEERLKTAIYASSIARE